jgi:hypothetical protein
MITTGSSSLELKFEVAINGVPFDITAIQRVSIELQENMHNIAILDIAGLPTKFLGAYVDAPIAIHITVAKTRSQFFMGYVAYLEPESKNIDGLVNKSPFQTTRIYCFGSSYVMRSRKTRAWNQKTLPQIATELADNYNFTVAVPNDRYVFPRLVQSGKSDWEFLVDAANYLGYHVVMRGTHIDIWDPYTSLSRYVSTPLYAMTGNKGNIQAQPGQVIKFSAKVGAVNPISAKVPDTIYALTSTNNISSLTQNTYTGYGEEVTSIFSDEIAHNADSIDMAQAIIKGRTRQKFPYTAEVEVVGDPTLEPGMAIDLDKYDSIVDGIWIVKSARHDMFRGSAMSYLTLVKDSNYNGVVNPTEKTSPAPVLPEPILKNGKWSTTKTLSYVYS